MQGWVPTHAASLKRLLLHQARENRAQTAGGPGYVYYYCLPPEPASALALYDIVASLLWVSLESLLYHANLNATTRNWPFSVSRLYELNRGHFVSSR